MDNYWHFEGGRKKATASSGKDIAAEKDGLGATQGLEGWVQDKAKVGAKWPKVQLYCLMGIKGSWTVSFFFLVYRTIADLFRIGILISRLVRYIILYIPVLKSFTL